VAFYHLPEAERIELTERAIANHSSVEERWSALATSEAAPWNARAEKAAKLLSAEKSVLDLGCGTMILERHLKFGTQYWPCDFQKRDSRTIICDLNIMPPPRVSESAVACLGVLEYLHAPIQLVETLAREYTTGVFSYCTTDSPNALDPRRAHAWVNDFDRAGLELIFVNSGWEIDFFEQHSEIQAMWRLISKRRHGSEVN
jgi:hypothetical protein